MKKLSLLTGIFAAATSVLINGAIAEDSMTSTTSTITSDGTVQTINPTSSQIVVSSSTADAPSKYTYTKTTTFVDGAGNVVSYESIKPNTPARIYYTKVGESYVVTKYVTNPTTTTTTSAVPAVPAAPVMEETTTTTTTTTGK